MADGDGSIGNIADICNVSDHSDVFNGDVYNVWGVAHGRWSS